VPDNSKQLAKLRKLKDLADSPKEQAACALELLEKERDRQVLGEALAVLKEVPTLEARPVLVDRYQYYAADGPKRDAGATLRSAILYALRPFVRQDDRVLLEKAALTYEQMPSRHDAEGGLLRSVALTLLNDLDEALAGYYAVKILVDKVTSEMSGEPALTAAKILAGQGNYLPLYQYLLLDASQTNSEVSAVCLRSLERAPDNILATLVARYRHSSSEGIQLGLFDLLLAHPSGPQYCAIFSDFLKSTTSFEMYRYVLLALITSGKPQFQAGLPEMANNEKDRLKREILAELLPMLKGYENEHAGPPKKLTRR
jgi:hypothetical protein